MGPIPLSFDVTDALPADITGGQRISIAAWLFFPNDLQKLGSKPVVMSLLNGGSYDKRYFHIEIPGHSGYSAAEHLAALGNIVLVPDHLGVGESSRAAEQKKATRQVVALANHAAATQFHERLRSGGLHPALPAIPDFVKIGGGHSMGGKGQRVRADNGSLGTPEEDYLRGSRDFLHEGFHWDDVPADIITADDAMAVPTPSVIGMDSIRTGIVSADTGRIDVPTYICLGERDVSPDAHAEPTYYKRCRDLTLHVLPRSGHCQNFASTRQQMWNRMHRWASCVAAC